MNRLASLFVAALFCACTATIEGPNVPQVADANGVTTTPDGGIGGGTPDAPIVIIPRDAGGLLFDPCTTDPQSGYDPITAGLPSCCDGPAHCVPKKEVIPLLAAYLGSCESGDVCMPDPIIKGGGNYRPPSCTSSVVGAAGACLSKCIPLVADNPLSVLLMQDDCGAGDLCIPCKNPLDGTQTGACNLLDQLCPAGAPDGGVDAGPATCPHTGPPIIDPATLPGCAPACAGAHCLPATLVPAAQQPLLKGCEATGGAIGFCAPDELIATGGNFIPKSCTSVAGTEGRCLSTCLPDVAEKLAFLPKSVCADDERCVPCYDPTSSEPTAATGACNLACDSPKKPPTVISCPWTGPPVIDPKTLPACAPACAGAHCIPSSLVPASLQGLLATCTDGFCTPDPLIASAGETPPKTCTSVAGAEGRCMSTCIPEIAGKASLLPKDNCDTGEVCAPCYDPTSSEPLAPTGACSIACDQPVKPPTILTCPWTGPPIIDPAKFPDCSPTCGGAHCVPGDLVPSNLQSLLKTCTGGFCAPDQFISTAGHFLPATCTSIAGAEGRCLSTCLPDVADKADLLPQATCSTNERCVPCYDPTSSNPTEATGACSTGCDMPKTPPVVLTCPWTGPPVIDATLFPSCSPQCNGAHCVPADLIPAGEADLLAKCKGGYCAPDSIIETANNWVPKSCSSVAGAEGRCLSTCLPEVSSQPLLPQSTCPTDTKCVPCYDPTSGSPTVATGACSLACDMPKRPPVVISCPWTGPAVLDPKVLPPCAPACGGSHCLPKAYVPADQQAVLAPCPGGYCTPDPIIQTADHWVPNSCRSIAGVEGRCLSECLPEVSSQPLLPQGTCAPDERCVPCYNPIDYPDTPTGACSLGCDEPAEPPTHLTCPWNGPAIIDPSKLPACSPACGGSHCLPAQYVPADQQALLATCPGGFCTPDPLIQSANNWNPASCRSIAGAEGRCLSTCLPDVAAQTLLPSAGCAINERCVPCFDPTSSNPDEATGACSLGCDKPAESPLHLNCPWTGPAVIDPSKLPGCCSGAHCLPNAYVPAGQADQLATCGSGASAGRCTPDNLITTAGNTDPPNCMPYSGTTSTSADGRCLSECLPAVQGQPNLEQGGCPGGNRCAPCWNPVNGDSTGACGAIGCDQPGPANKWLFPHCCSNNGICVAASQLGSQAGSLAPADCPNGNTYRCAPVDQVPGTGRTPKSCHVSASVVPPFSWTNVCVPDCIIDAIAGFCASCLIPGPTVGCPQDWSCAPP